MFIVEDKSGVLSKNRKWMSGKLCQVDWCRNYVLEALMDSRLLLPQSEKNGEVRG